MSSNEYRSVNALLSQFQNTYDDGGVSDEIPRSTELSAASNDGHFTRAVLPSGGRWSR